ncbi:sugar ABC transporter permease [Vallitalea pronyensis]|uniref:Sugar ABC transporter permease n=2 Tax=Vallitalea pronyensis TaxID=1348613 RepID=A0A8J8MQP5_9FIRM|nr:sugar ABC transporter permease [Vallitalea pronyensis]
MDFYYSFTDYNIVQPSTFAGLKNYSYLIKDPFIRAAVRNTFVYTIIVVPTQTILALVLANLLAKLCRNRWGNFVRSSLFIPVISSMILVGSIWRIFLRTDGGFINNVLRVIGISNINWLGDKDLALISICIVAIWKSVGYFLVIYYAGIMDIPSSLYEAAKVDGATPVQQFFNITLPMLKPITYLVVTLGTIWSFQVFDLVYTMTGGGPGFATNTLVLNIYTSAFKEYRMGYASAISILLLIMILCVSVIQKATFDRKTGGVK